MYSDVVHLQPFFDKGSNCSIMHMACHRAMTLLTTFCTLSERPSHPVSVFALRAGTVDHINAKFFWGLKDCVETWLVAFLVCKRELVHTSCISLFLSVQHVL